MISEGVNIPHLRVGVYMTTIQSPLRWTQILGRVLRTEKELDWHLQTAHFFQYDDGTTLVEGEDGNELSESIGIKLFAETLEQEREALLKISKEKKKQEKVDVGSDSDGNYTKVEAISTEALSSDQVYGGERYASSKLERFKILSANIGVAEAKLAHFVEIGGKENWLLALK